MKIFALLFLLTALFLIPLQAKANQSLNFQAPDSSKKSRVVAALNELKNTPNEKYSIAAVDLNGDSLDEYILRPENLGRCEQKKFCPYVIMALQDHKPIIIGEFKAHKVLISNKKTYGIKHILIYNDPNNDYKSTLTIWDPFSFRFQTQAER